MAASHRTLRCWQTATAIVDAVQEASKAHWQPRLREVFNQVQRSALSVQLNIAEGYSYGPSPTCTKLLRVAYGSAVETSELLDLLIRQGAWPSNDTQRVTELSEECLRTLRGFIRKYSS